MCFVILFSLRGELSLQGEPVSAHTGVQIWNNPHHVNFHVKHRPEGTHCLLKKKPHGVAVGGGASQINFGIKGTVYFDSGITHRLSFSKVNNDF